MKKENLLIVGALIFACALPLGAVVKNKIDRQQYSEIFKDVDENRFIKNSQGQSLILPINNYGVDLLIDDNFTESQKSTICNAIAECDISFPNIKYNFCFNPSDTHGKYITITKGKLNGTLLGSTKYHSSSLSYYLQYPISIVLDCEKTPNSNILESVVKHELLHTLGLADMYDKSYEGSTIMYYKIDGRTELSNQDIKIINTVYSNYKKQTFTLQTFVKSPTVNSYVKLKNEDLNFDISL